MLDSERINEPGSRTTHMEKIRMQSYLAPYEIVKQHFNLPFELYPFQGDSANELAPLPRAGYYLDVGCGKTATATVAVLYKFLTQDVEHCVCHMPPILLDRWSKWFEQVTWKDGRPLKVTTYRGTPAQRKTIKLEGDFILMSTQIFKLDYDAIHQALGHKVLAVLVDEATSVKNVGSDNHKKTHSFAEGQHLLLLTGTPLSTPLDGYAFCKMVAPGIYRDLRQFENIHVAERVFKTITEWKNLDLLRDNIKVHAVRVLKTDVLLQLPSVTYDPIFYQLDPAHMKLYRKLAEEQLLPLKNGGKIDKTSEIALVHALGQIIVNYDYFADDPKCVSRTVELIQEIMQELEGRKLLVFANYRMSNRKLIELLKPYGALGAFGDLSTKQQAKNIELFINHPEHNCLCAQPTAVGYGVDGLQEVCHDTLFVETPTVAKDFYQSLGRIWRDGQRNKVHCRIAVAEGTLQVRKLRQLLNNDDLVSQVQRSYADLAAEMFGE